MNTIPSCRIWICQPSLYRDLAIINMHNGMVKAGCSELGDIRDYKTTKEFRRAIDVKGLDLDDEMCESLWNFANSVRSGDIIIARCGKDDILGIGIVKNGYHGPNTRNVDWSILDDVHSPNPFRDIFLEDITDDRLFVEKLLKLCGKDDLLTKVYHELENAELDLKELEEELSKLDETEISSYATMRKGQEKLRRYLILKYGKCVVSGVDDPELLVASHILAWKKCASGAAERLDPENVLLLAKNYDALFDRYMISFDSFTGKMVVSKRVSLTNLLLMGIPAEYTSLGVGTPSTKRAHYLRLHRQEMDRRDQEGATD